MKKITDYNLEFQSPPEPETPFSEQEARLITWIWAKMTARYGNLWSSQFLDDRINKITKAEWMQKLRKYPHPQIYQAVEDWNGKYPPNIQELLETMREKDMHKDFKRLQKPNPNPVVAKRNIELIRRKLR